MRKLSVNFIGCGKLGKTMAALLQQHGIAIGGIVTSSLESANHTVRVLGEGTACARLSDLPEADIWFIATPDDNIEKMARNLQQQGKLHAGNIVLHASGSLSSAILSCVRDCQCHVASMHFFKSFADTGQALATFRGTFCAMEGDAEALSALIPLFKKSGCHVFSMQANDKTLCHAGSVIANNYLLTLHAQAMQCFLAAGIEKAMANKMVNMLMQDALNNLHEHNYQQALTGPMQRGDANTIRQHVATLTNETRKLYISLGKATIGLTSHDTTTQQKLYRALDAREQDNH